MIVRKLRLQRGWSQDQLAEIADLSVRTIQRLERGQKPSLESARALASVFEVDIQTFNTEEATMNDTSSHNSMPADNTASDNDEAIEREVARLLEDEKRALKYAKRVKEFYEGVITLIVIAVVFFAVVGFNEPILYWVILGVGAGLAIQGLIAFEVIRFSWTDWEKRLVEKKLGRKL